MNYQLHALCTIFPRLMNADFDKLCQDIKAQGLIEPIVLFDGQILDGGNRYHACLKVGVEPRFVQFDGADPASYVVSKNFHRRHLVPGQFAVIVAAATNWAEAHTAGSNQHKTKTMEGSATWHHLSSVADRAAQAKVSVRTQKRADKVFKADPKLAEKVAHGEMSLPAAVKQVEAKNPPKPRKAKPTTSVATETASPVTPDQKAPGPVTTTDGDDNNPLGDFDPLDEMKRMQDELDVAHRNLQRALAQVAELEAALARDDNKAAILDLIRARDTAHRTRDDSMANAVAQAGRAKRYEQQLARIGRAVGERDLDKVPQAVETLARRFRAVITAADARQILPSPTPASATQDREYI